MSRTVIAWATLLLLLPASIARADEFRGKVLKVSEGDLLTVSRDSKPTPLRLLEGTDEKGRKIRQVACVVAGKGGDLLLSVVSSQETWDQAMVDRFLRSIR